MTGTFSSALKGLRATAAAIALLWVFCGAAAGQQNSVRVRYDPFSRVFRMDAADVTYVLGVNEQEQVQTLYWGKRLSSGDAFPPAHSPRGSSSFDSPVTVTPHEFAGWGGGLYLEPDLKITFPDGNRDLALKYVSYKIEGDALSIVMKDISREVYVTLHYAMDAETGIICRGAEIENRTGSPFTIEQVAAGTYNLPRGTDNAVLAGCGTVPGVGVPTALISGRLAADRVTGPVPARVRRPAVRRPS